jgi:hypothetical protein
VVNVEVLTVRYDIDKICFVFFKKRQKPKKKSLLIKGVKQEIYKKKE